MTYSTQARMANDVHLVSRVTACASTQGVAAPQAWAWEHSWPLSAEPGWDSAYAYALGQAVPNPGDAEGVITDAMILAAVQKILTAERAAA